MNRIKILTTLLIAYLRIIKNNRIVLYPSRVHPILVNFGDGKFVPYIKGLFWFESQDKIHALLTNWKFVLEVDKIERKERLPLSFALFPLKKKYRTLITDKIHLKSEDKWKFLSPAYFNWVKVRTSNITPLPFVMHHTQYGDNNPPRGQEKRKVRIFFSGNAFGEAYRNPVFTHTFGILNRVEILEVFKELASSSEPDISFTIERQAPVWILDWGWSPGAAHHMENRIPNQSWLNYLKKSDFFLCCPGVNMPFSHNAIEAMSVGSIPILQYNTLFVPELVHGNNCFVFTSRADLIEVIKEISHMEETTIDRMRKEVLSYFEKHLSPRAIQDKVENPENREFVFPVNVHSVNAYLREFPDIPLQTFNR